MDLVALVPADIADLIPVFLENRSKELDQLRTALGEANFVRLNHFGERMYALGNPYGFRQITTFGRHIREACSLQNKVAIGQVLDQYEDYLSKVTMAVVSQPVERIPWSMRTVAANEHEKTDAALA
jgi:hypothetical protein